MKRAKRGVSSRLPASPQRGWSGVQILRDGREPRAKLEEIVERLPHRQSSIAHLLGELCEYGARFCSDLAQDEYGPTRAERAAALKEALEPLEQARSAIEDLGSTARHAMEEALTATRATNDYASADPLDRFEADKRHPEGLWQAAMETSQHLESCGSSTDLEVITRLGMFADQASLRLQNLDTTTDGELFLQWTTREASRDDGRGDVGTIDGPIRRLEDRLRRELNRLSRLKGPDSRTSLPLFVARLCDLWERESGLPVTVNPYEKTQYRGLPQSEAGAFVCEVVEALKPELSEQRELMGFSGRESPPHLKSQLGWSPTAIHSAMRLYIKARDSNPERARKKHTL
jgi:hypothetical protein